MPFELINKTALVTGSTDGLGRLIALELAQKGVNVIIHGKNEKKLAEVLKELKSINENKEHDFVFCDLNHPETVKEAFSHIKDLDILINNAGLWAEGNTIDISHERIMELVNVNLASYLLVTRTLLPKLHEAEFSQLLNVVSVAGYEVPSQYFHTIYSATKYGLQGFSEAMAK